MAHLHSVVVVHRDLGRITLDDVVSVSSMAVVARGQALESGRALAVTLGRGKGQGGRGSYEAFARKGDGGPFYRKPLTRPLIDAALLVQARRLVEEPSFRVTCHGVAEWVDPALAMSRPAVVTDLIEGTRLSGLDALGWREKAWEIVAALLATIMVTPDGEKAPHQNLTAANVIQDKKGNYHVVNPGVAFSKEAVASSALYVEGNEPWPDDEQVFVTSLSAYPTFPPGAPGADLQALGLMVYEGLTGTDPLVGGNPAPGVFNFGHGSHGRGVPSPKLVIGEIPPLDSQLGWITEQMAELVDHLLWAPFGHELTLGLGKSLRTWVSACQKAAGAVEKP